MPRKGLSQRVRFEVFKRDGFKCYYCGRTPPDVNLQVDHVLPVSKGGTSEITNLVTSCFDCNIGKSNKDLTSIPKSLQDHIETTKQETKNLQEYAEVMRQFEDLKDQQAWDIINALELRQVREHGVVSKEWYGGVRRLLTLLPCHEMLDTAIWTQSRLAWKTDKHKFMVFCKSCWNKIREQQPDEETAPT
jgi:hypothetical protein